MRQFIFVVVFILVGLSIAVAQKGKCSNNSDPFTGEQFSYFELTYYGTRSLYYESKQNVISLQLFFSHRGGFDNIYPKGTELLLKLESGDVLSLLTMEESKPNVIVAGASGYTSTYTRYSFILGLTTDDLQKLATSKVSIIRYPNPSGGTLDKNAKEYKKIIKAINDGAICLTGTKK